MFIGVSNNGSRYYSDKTWINGDQSYKDTCNYRVEEEWDSIYIEKYQCRKEWIFWDCFHKDSDLVWEKE